MLTPLSPAQARADRRQVAHGTDPLSVARRRTLAAFGVSLAQWVQDGTTMTRAMHAYERQVLLALAGQADPEQRTRTVAQYRAQVTERRTCRMRRVA